MSISKELPKEQRAILEDDRHLGESQLDDKYNPNGDGEHPVYDRLQWRYEVAHRETIIGYWAWVEYRIEKHHAGG